MKKLKRPDERKQINKKKSSEKAFVTKSVASDEAAIGAKMKAIEPKLLGIKLVKYDRGDTNKVWVPYYFLIYDFVVRRGLSKNHTNDRFAKKGRIAVVHDANEMHASLYDVAADGEIPFEEKDVSATGAIVLPEAGKYEEILSNAERTIQRQMLFKAYKTEGELSIISAQKFYREAWRLQVFYKDREFIKYAYLDDYGVHNERARGLKTRMDNF